MIAPSSTRRGRHRPARSLSRAHRRPAALPLRAPACRVSRTACLAHRTASVACARPRRSPLRPSHTGRERAALPPAEGRGLGGTSRRGAGGAIAIDCSRCSMSPIAATRADPRLAVREDILAMLVQARDENGGGLSSDDLRDDLVALIGARATRQPPPRSPGVAVLLAHNLDVRERATVARADGDRQYLRALVKEALRIRPPLPVAAGRVLNRAGLRLDPTAYPRGTLDHDRCLGPAPRPGVLSGRRAIRPGAVRGPRCPSPYSLAALRRRRPPLRRGRAR